MTEVEIILQDAADLIEHKGWAFRRALDAHTEARKVDEHARLANWQRIQAEDAATIARSPTPKDPQ